MEQREPAIAQLLQIMERLRDPETGCPWDQKQTYQTIVPYTLEEAYEVADAIERGDRDDLRGELGDLLFQVVFYCQIAREEGAFDFEQVAAGIADKMRRRHPHVFAGVEAGDDQQLREAWESIKSGERAAGPDPDVSQLAGVAKALPALLRADKLQRRAADVGFDWPNPDGALEKVREEIAEVEQAAGQPDPQHLEEELGDLLFAAVNVVRLHGFQAEHALRGANDKFERRFRRMEERLREAGRGELSALSLDEWEDAWSMVKQEEKPA